MEANKKIPLNGISVCARFYKREHEKNPRGLGKWAFSIGNTEGCRDVSKVFWVDKVVMYTEDCDIAKREAQARGVRAVYVLP